MSFLKDAAYILALVVSITTLWNTLKNKIENLEEKNKLLHKIVFQKSGELNIMTESRCMERYHSIQKVLRQNNADALKLNRKIETLNENIIIIMVHMSIDKDKIRPGGKCD